MQLQSSSVRLVTIPKVQQDSNSDALSVLPSISKEAGHLIEKDRERESSWSLTSSVWIRAVGVCLHNEGVPYLCCWTSRDQGVNAKLQNETASLSSVDYKQQ